ncbi:serine phosphatase [Desulfovibrio sp. X2]|uniref:PP2C family protein-serine/threonine phosphatase n=1 Tax=Desulfovibrio sp. X2 TaxID=941449 RepID=UPI000358DC63|nr:GAF domain-containing SpoIIE family protein phosphatase [Desulfovibrio sp. X2]EPR44007.1 serine phosphatase [Desulfovibrio sp. X2]
MGSGSGQARRLRHLISASQSLAEIESLPELLDRLLSLAQEVTGSEASSLLLWDPATRLLSFAHARNDVLGSAAADLLRAEITLRLGEGVAGWVARERTSLIVNEARSDERFSDGADRSTGFTTRCLLCVPVVHRDELLGVLQVLNATHRTCYDAEDREVLESFANLAAVAIVRARLLKARLEQQRMTTQLETAARIQAHFWPTLPDLPHGSRLWAASRPAAFVGGDLFDCIPLPDGSLLLYVADVAGKGLPAALVMAALWSRVRTEAQVHEDVGELLAAVNEPLVDLFAGELFVTALAGRYHPASGCLQFARAGHVPPCWITPAGLCPPPETAGLPLGIAGGVSYAAAEITVGPGDSVLFLTDGVTEARAPCGTAWDEGCLGRLADGDGFPSCPPYGPAALASAREWLAGNTACDDMTVLEIWREA